MATDDLIARLAGDLKPVQPDQVGRRVAIGFGASLAVSSLLMYFWLGLRPDMMSAVWTWPFWVKLGYTFALSLAGIWAVKRIAYPLGRIRPHLVAIAMAVTALVALAIGQLSMMPPESHMPLLMGKSVAVCTLYITTLAMPFLVGAFWILRGLAPTRLTLAGAAAGLAAGGLGSLVYSFHCTEGGMPFIAIWYTLGVMGPALIGALAGRYLLRW
ncbi:DUF1109 domain-containing protein [Phyllobacterium sp. 21LDTY02-6]|uniref:NrsF family protein n=1 Tax=unclassified Phyllobacterium TaxID=2638441 RepID=UPI0020224C51|nr:MULTISPECIES: DUF1109 domain-containing protein [unclassified Phyllobacterium]MCO4315733.1 DUF1109 domain-containing protein [Phyllobacterium sp. 21LDTY02-6]MCX8280855.1 DUF1109 domain-containing protein [Phyllobacterium sp. 0TCS1.6C]MCX8295721.1 DUF1109 domain-containing protein [Phyllobacterium sp. 0TCS1.6A]